MELWSVWVIVALVFVIVEIFTSGFGVLCFSFGCLAAAPVALIPDSLVWQVLAFAVVSLLSFIFLRPVLMKLLVKNSQGGAAKSNADAIVGKVAVVSEAIEEKGFGRVKLDGDEWKAVSSDGAAVEKGARVEIVSRESLIVTVKTI